MNVLSLVRNRLRDTEKLLKIRNFFQQNTEIIFQRLAALYPKCKVVHFTAPRSRAQRPSIVRIGNTLLPVEESTKFLGLWCRAANQYGISVFCTDFTCKIREYEFGLENTEIELCQFCHLKYCCQNKAYLFWVANQSGFVAF